MADVDLVATLVHAHWCDSAHCGGPSKADTDTATRIVAALAPPNRTPTQWAYDRACAALAKHRDRADAAEAEIERLHSWAGVMSLLDEHYPASIFPTTDDREVRDAGARIVSLLRNLNMERAEVERLRDWCEHLARLCDAAAIQYAAESGLAAETGARMSRAFAHGLRQLLAREHASAPGEAR